MSRLATHNNFLQRADDVLRGRATRPPWSLIVVCGAAYGAVMGGYAIWNPSTETDTGQSIALQVLYSAIKVPLLLVITLALALPSFFIANTIFGLQTDFRRALRVIVASQAALTLVLFALAPLTLVCYASGPNYSTAILFNALMFATASIAAQFILRRGYAPLIVQNRRHKKLLYAWLFIYAFVGIQLGWTLRPFIGAPGQPATFLRAGQRENAYVVVARILLSPLRSRSLSR